MGGDKREKVAGYKREDEWKLLKNKNKKREGGNEDNGNRGKLGRKRDKRGSSWICKKR